jgi:hypothetical protein
VPDTSPTRFCCARNFNFGSGPRPAADRYLMAPPVGTGGTRDTPIGWCPVCPVPMDRDNGDMSRLSRLSPPLRRPFPTLQGEVGRGGEVGV